VAASRGHCSGSCIRSESGRLIPDLNPGGRFPDLRLGALDTTPRILGTLFLLEGCGLKAAKQLLQEGCSSLRVKRGNVDAVRILVFWRHTVPQPVQDLHQALLLLRRLWCGQQQQQPPQQRPVARAEECRMRLVHCRSNCRGCEGLR